MRYGLFLAYLHLQLETHKVTFRYCIPMDKDRPSLDLKYFEDICLDKKGMSIYDLLNRD
jgi:hypothetical protein